MSPLALSLRFLQTQPDGRLVELSRLGHERAFEALVQRYRRQLLAYCRRITASEASAEDALQQGLLQAWMALSTSDVEVRDARAWLYRIVHNVAISNLRRTQPDAVEVDDARRASGADHEVERRLAVREALAGLASLPELQRQVMLSTALEGRSHDEIAAALGLSHGAVRGLIYRARATLRAAAAAVTPAPLVHWAVRQQTPGAGRSAGLVETLAAGGGGAGLGGVLLKGGALVVSAGALATAAGITSTHSQHRSHHHAHVVARHSSRGAGGAAQAAAAGAMSGVPVSALRLASASAGTAHRRGSDAGSGHGHGGRSGSHSGHGGHSVFFGGSPHDHSGGSGPGGGGGHGTGSGRDGTGSGRSGQRPGSDGGSGGGQQSGHDGSRTGSATSGGGGSGGDHGGGEGGTLSSTMTVTSSSGGTGDGGGGGSGGDGGGDHTSGTTTGSTTTVTTTSTTTSGSATSGD